MADASDSKSDVGDYVWVQVPSPAWIIYRQIIEDSDLAIFCIIKEERDGRWQSCIIIMVPWGAPRRQMRL